MRKSKFTESQIVAILAEGDWVQDYNEFRPHESLGDVAPMEFMPRKFVKEISSFKLST